MDGTANSTSSPPAGSRKRPRRMRIKKYNNAGSSIDMTGEIRDCLVEDTNQKQGDDHEVVKIRLNGDVIARRAQEWKKETKSSTATTVIASSDTSHQLMFEEARALHRARQHQQSESEFAMQQQQEVDNFVSTQSGHHHRPPRQPLHHQQQPSEHSQSQRGHRRYPSSSQSSSMMALLHAASSSSPMSYAMSSDSSDDDEGVENHPDGHELDGSFPSLRKSEQWDAVATKLVELEYNQQRKQQQQQEEDEINGDHEYHGVPEQQMADEGYDEDSERNDDIQGITASDADAVNITTSSELDVWEKIVLDQSDTNTSQEESTVTKLQSQNSQSASYGNNNTSSSGQTGTSSSGSAKSKEATSRYAAYRASLSRNLFGNGQDDSEGGDDNNSRERHDPRGLPSNAVSHILVQDLSPAKHSVFGDSSDGSAEIFHDNSFDETNHNYHHPNARPTPPPAKEDHEDHHQKTSYHHDGELQDVVESTSTTVSGTDNHDDDNKDNGNNFASIPGDMLSVSRDTASIPQNTDDEYDMSDSPYGLLVPDLSSNGGDNVYYEQQQQQQFGDVEQGNKNSTKMNRGLSSEEQEERAHIARGLAAAAMAQRHNLSHRPPPPPPPPVINQATDEEGDLKPTPLPGSVAVHPSDDANHINKQENKRETDDGKNENNRPYTRTDVKFQLWVEKGVYVHSSASESPLSAENSSSGSSLVAPIPTKKSRKSIYEENASGSWRKWLGVWFAPRPLQPEPIMAAEDVQCIQGVATSAEKSFLSLESAPPRSVTAVEIRAVQAQEGDSSDYSDSNDRDDRDMQSVGHVVEPEGFYDEQVYGASGSVPLEMNEGDEMMTRTNHSREDDEKKKMARMLAAAAIFKKDDLNHVEQTNEKSSSATEQEPNRLVELKSTGMDKDDDEANNSKALQASIAAAAAAMAAKRNNRSASMTSEDYDKRYDKKSVPLIDVDEQDVAVPEGSFGAQAAAIAAARRRNREALKSAEDFDRLYKKPPPEKKEPQRLVQLRSVQRESNPENKMQEDSEPQRMAKLKPISTETPHPYANLPPPLNKQQMENKDDTNRSLAAEQAPEDNEPSTRNNYFLWPKWSANGSPTNSKDLEGQSDSSYSSASSLTNLEPVFYKVRLGLSAGAWRHIARASALLLLLAAIALPLYFLVFSDSDESTVSPQIVGSIFPPIATEAPTFPPSQSPSTSASLSATSLTPNPSFKPATSPNQDHAKPPGFGPTILPSTQAPTLQGTIPPLSPSQPQNVPTPAPSNDAATTAPSAFVPNVPNAPTSEEATNVPTDTASSNSLAPVVNQETKLRNFLVSAWPQLEQSLDVPNTNSTAMSPQIQAFEWLAADANLIAYSDAQQLQRFAMATFYFSTGGDNWNNNSGWLSDGNECMWYTASSFRTPCDDSGNLVSLDLEGNGLSGQLPPELALVSNSLRSLELSAVGEDGVPVLSGTLPSEIGMLTLLNYLSLSNQRLTGTLPPEIGQMSLLTVLDLDNNQFNGPLVTSVGQLQQLNNLYLGGNRLSGDIPTELGALQFLVNLDLYGNRLGPSIPTQLGNLSILQSLSVGYNQLQGSIPTQLCRLTNLQGSLDLSGNQLTGIIPTQIGRLSLMRNSLNLASNQLSGSLPSELGRLVNLGRLYLQDNMFTGSVPLSFSSLVQLEVLRLDSNDLLGSIPTVVCDALVTEKTNIGLDPTFFVTDCVAEIECTCCQYCCEDGVGCACQFSNTDKEFLCPAADLEEPSQVFVDVPP